MTDSRELWTLQWVNSQRKVFEWTFTSIQEVENIKKYLIREYNSPAEAFVITEGRPTAPIITHTATKLGGIL